MRRAISERDNGNAHRRFAIDFGLLGIIYFAVANFSIAPRLKRHSLEF
jgi:hypothetical protein